MNADGSDERQLSLCAADDCALSISAVSPMGDRIAYTFRLHDGLHLLDPSTGDEIVSDVGHGDSVDETTWSPDGSQLAVLVGPWEHSTLWFVDAETGRARQVLAHAENGDLSWLPQAGGDAGISGVNGDVTYVGGPAPGVSPFSEPGSVVVYTEGGDEVARADFPAGEGFSLALYPGTYRIVGTSGDAMCEDRHVSVEPGRFTDASITCSVM